MLYELSDLPTLREALAASVDAAMYWQEPDETDAMLEDEAFAVPLAAVAEQVASAPEAQWLWDPLTADQYAVRWFERHPDTGRETEPRPIEPQLIGDELARWKHDEEESQTQFIEFYRRHPYARMGGEWWVLPQFAGVWTSPALGRLGPAALHFVEDTMGYERARVWPIRPQPGARVLEITAPQDWAELCRRFPLEVTASRRSDWGRATGRYGRWVLPDWPAVAGEWDAVHVTGAGYLRASGRAIAVDSDVASMLAGWDPGMTAWLTDAFDVSGTAVDWVGGGTDWVAVG
jgi:hypothetical protein